jgi:probable dihydroxyacetone kinase regulator
MSNSAITKNALATGLKQLTGKMNFDKITIADITDVCGLNRQTFYYHFTDKLDLLYWIYDNEAFSLTKDINVNNWDEKLKKFMRHMRRDRNFYMNTIKCSDNYFEEYLYNELKGLMFRAIEDIAEMADVKELPEGVTKRLDNDEKLLMSSFFSHALCGMIVEWAMGGMKENENTLTDTLKLFIIRVLHTNII